MQIISGKWKGTFTYGELYGQKAGASVQFHIELEEKDGYFKGRCHDELIPADHFASISGFMDEEFISFVKKYPYYLEMDEEGHTTPDPDRPAHDIHYAGTMDGTTISGVFEFGNLPSFVHSDEIYEGGSFTMTRITEPGDPMH